MNIKDGDENLDKVKGDHDLWVHALEGDNGDHADHDKL